ncbi:MAG: hypothetical protein WEE89_11675 [Gemmatimonadota bacterium]
MHMILAVIPILSFQFDECRYSATREATVDAAAASRIYVSAGSGTLRVEGKPGLRQARLRGTACASDRRLLEEIELTATRSGTEVRVHSNDNDKDLRNREYARLDLVIEVPENLATEIDDSSGDIQIYGLGAVHITDGSGEIVADDIRGSLTIDDGSGEIKVTGVRGDLKITDGSGEIDALDIGGIVDIRDGSGQITVSKTLRDVLISDSSGGIDVDDVGGAFTVRNDGSGGIHHRAVRGTVSLPAKFRRSWY